MFDTHSNAIVGFSRIGDPGENSHCSESRLKSYQLDLPLLRSDLGDFVASLFLVAILSEVDICSLLYRQLTLFITFQQIHQRFVILSSRCFLSCLLRTIHVNPIITKTTNGSSSIVGNDSLSQLLGKRKDQNIDSTKTIHLF